MNERPEEPAAAEPIPVAQFEGEFVRQMEGKLPAITLEMPEGYARGTHLKMEVEVRVRNVRYEEIRTGPDKGDLRREHVFALEAVKLLGAFTAEELDPGVGGSASAAAIGRDEDDEPEEPKQSQVDPTVTQTGAIANQQCMNPDCLVEEGERHWSDCTPETRLAVAAEHIKTEYADVLVELTHLMDVHPFEGSYTGMVCDRMVMRDGGGDQCGLPPEHATHQLIAVDHSGVSAVVDHSGASDVGF